MKGGFRTKLAALALVAFWGSRVFGCEACQDSQVFKDSFVNATNAAAEAASTAAPAAAPATAAVPQPRERVSASEAAASPSEINEAPVRKPSLRIRSFNELR
jgi:hypothetical protein